MIVKKEKLQAHLDKCGFTRTEFAARLGVDIAEVDKMLSGEAVPSTPMEFVSRPKSLFTT